MNKKIDPYNEEIWEDVEIEERWTIVRNTLLGCDTSKKSYSKEEAERLCKRWNKECDVYENYTVEKIK